MEDEEGEEPAGGRQAPAAGGGQPSGQRKEEAQAPAQRQPQKMETARGPVSPPSQLTPLRPKILMDTGEEPPPSGAQPQQGGQQPQEGDVGQQGGSPAAQPQARTSSQAPTIKTQQLLGLRREPPLGAAKILLDTGEFLPSAPQPSGGEQQQGGGILRARPPSGILPPPGGSPSLAASSPTGTQHTEGGQQPDVRTDTAQASPSKLLEVSEAQASTGSLPEFPPSPAREPPAAEELGALLKGRGKDVEKRAEAADYAKPAETRLGGGSEEGERRRLEELARRGRRVRVAFSTAFSATDAAAGCPTPQKRLVQEVYGMAERRARELMRQHPWLYYDMALDIAYAELADKGVIKLEELEGGGERVSVQAPFRYKTVLLARGGKMVELPEGWGEWDEGRRAEWLRRKLGELGSGEAAFAVVSEDIYGNVKVEQVFVQPEGPLGREAPTWAGVAGVPADLDALKRVRPNLVTVARGQLEEYLSPPKVTYAVKAVAEGGREVALEAPLTREQFEAELRRVSPGALFQLAGVWVQAPSGSPSKEELDRLYGEFLAAWAARQGYRRLKAGGETVEVPENLGTMKAPVGGSALFLKPETKTFQLVGGGSSATVTVTEKVPVAAWIPPELRSF